MDQSTIKNSDPDSGEFKDRLRLGLAHAGLSQVELAKRMPVHQNLVGGWIGGRGYPSFRHLATLALVLEVDIDWLVLGRGVPPSSRQDDRLGERVRRLAPELMELVELARQASS